MLTHKNLAGKVTISGPGRATRVRVTLDNDTLWYEGFGVTGTIRKSAVQSVRLQGFIVKKLVIVTSSDEFEILGSKYILEQIRDWAVS